MRVLIIRLFILLGLCFPALVLPGAAHAVGLNDTGITGCWDDNPYYPRVVTTGVEADSGSHPRQDCRYGRDAAAAAGMPKTGGGGKGFDFSKIANNGSVLPASAALGSGATDWACTRDNVTGLIWEVKTATGPRGQSHTYTWYDSNPATNGGSVGAASGGTCFVAGRCDTEKFAADVNAVGLCGAADWRMPTRKELVSIVDYGRVNPAIDPGYFPNTPASSSFWSASAEAASSCCAWDVHFSDGRDAEALKESTIYVRLVRAGQ